LVSAVRRGESRSLVLCGEAGIGKTALLEYLVASASELKVVRAVGVGAPRTLWHLRPHALRIPGVQPPIKGEATGVVVRLTFSPAGEAQHVSVNHRSRSSVLLLSRLMGDKFADTAIGEHFITSKHVVAG
jgi:hypothetical protein